MVKVISVENSLHFISIEHTAKVFEHVTEVFEIKTPSLFDVVVFEYTQNGFGLVFFTIGPLSDLLEEGFLEGIDSVRRDVFLTGSQSPGLDDQHFEVIFLLDR